MSNGGCWFLDRVASKGLLEKVTSKQRRSAPARRRWEEQEACVLQHREGRRARTGLEKQLVSTIPGVAGHLKETEC